MIETMSADQRLRHVIRVGLTERWYSHEERRSIARKVSEELTPAADAKWVDETLDASFQIKRQMAHDGLFEADRMGGVPYERTIDALVEQIATSAGLSDVGRMVHFDPGFGS